MKKISLMVVLSLMCLGCVTVQNVPETEKISAPAEKKESLVKEILAQSDSSKDAEEVQTKEVEGLAEKKGIIFAKTDFQGLLETRYVRFLLENPEKPDYKFQLNIGEDLDQKTFPWEFKTVKPGYFFVELPAGHYKVVSVSIPVGSTMATEDISITLEVVPNVVSYVGTLKMIGTKEKIKLGGLPVIKPGFEYTVEVLDEREEGIEAFRKNYPNFVDEINVKLMQVNPVAVENKTVESGS